jgi:hypothetical protein
VEHAFSLTTSDAEEFQERIAPLAGACGVRPDSGTRFGIAGLWFDLQRADRSRISPIEIAEKAGAVFMHFVLASEVAAKLSGRYAWARGTGCGRPRGRRRVPSPKSGARSTRGAAGRAGAILVLAGLVEGTNKVRFAHFGSLVRAVGSMGP